MRMPMLAVAALLASAYAFPALAEGGCGWSAKTTTASDTSTSTTVIAADSGAKQSKPGNPKN